MLDQKETYKFLNNFAKYVIQQSRANLTRQNKNVDSKLYNSLDKQIEVGANSFRLSFLMEDYGAYQDKGVKGKTSSSKTPNSPFKFGTGSGRKGGLTDGISKWVQKRRIQFRDKNTGKFLSYKSTASLITRSVYRTGIKPSLFFTKPFEAAFERLPDELIEAYGLDLEQFLEYTLKK